MLAVPMILEMSLESVFAVVDIFFVSRLGNYATATVGLTESVITLVYSIAIGLSMAATAIISRRIGEKNPEEASKSAVQVIMITLMVTCAISIAGAVFAKDILLLMGAEEEVAEKGTAYTRIVFSSSIFITYLFVINGIFRGAGDASIAMRSLWIANICNIILCPTLIYGVGPIPAFGLTGAAIATAIGRGVGVCYQAYRLFNGRGVIHIRRHHFTPAWGIIRSIIRLASTGAFQFIIASASWIVLARIIAEFGNVAIAGYIIAMRIMMFFMLPAWGLSNAAATLVGQNLGAQQPDRAEASVWKTAQYNAIFMGIVTTIFILFGSSLASLISKDVEVIAIATQAMRIIALGYIAYGVSMVLTNAFNGAGDARTPTIINFFAFWMFQIPLAYLLAITFEIRQMGVFIAILIAETGISIISAIIFKKGKWKTMKV